MKILIMQSSLPSCNCLPHRILPGQPNLGSHNPRSSLHVRDSVSHSYKSTCEITFRQVLMRHMTLNYGYEGNGTTRHD